jgi:hypothetical protein
LYITVCQRGKVEVWQWFAQPGEIELDDVARGMVAAVHRDLHVEGAMRPNTLSAIAANMSTYVGIIDATESTP